MPHSANRVTRPKRTLEPTWDIAYLYPYQGEWSEDEYLALDTKRLVELSDRCLEFLPMPTTSHQLMIALLYGLLSAFIAPRDLGMVLFSGVRVRLWRGQIREPDVAFMLKKHAGRIFNEYWKGADLVMEVVSGSADDRDRDLRTKRREYARAGIAEYWLVDPQEATITVLRLAGKRYVVHGTFAKGEQASSCLLPGFTVDVTATFAQRVAPKKRSRKTK